MTTKPKWLLAFSVGPVGRFIGAGRRSRDVWFGSTWVSDCTRVVAEHLRDPGSHDDIDVVLDLPTPKRLDQIRRRTTTADTMESSFAYRVTNNILAEVSADSVDSVVRLATSAREAAHSNFAAILNDNRKRSRDQLGTRMEELLVGERFDSQHAAIKENDFVEIFAAWTSLVDDDDDPKAWKRASRRVYEILGAAKSARTFPAAESFTCRKSDVDPGRDSILHPTHVSEIKEHASNDDRRHASSDRIAQRIRLGIRSEEHLDAVGLARRVALLKRPEESDVDPRNDVLARRAFIPLSRIAVDHWLEAVHEDFVGREWLTKVIGSIEEATKSEAGATIPGSVFTSWCTPTRDPGRSTPLFPYDASCLLEGGPDALRAELSSKGIQSPDIGMANKTIKKDIAPIVQKLHRKFGTPSPYYAFLQMDGDGIGSRLAAADREQWERLTARLDEFADKVHGIVEAHHGCVLYCGGDDIAAYLPVDKALGTVEKLAEEFETTMREPGTTLSAGIVIAHQNFELREVRRIAEKALYCAKRARKAASDDRAWFTVREMPRGGDARTVTAPTTDLVPRLRHWSRLIRDDRLSLRTPHQLLGFARRFGPKQDKSETSTEQIETSTRLAQARIVQQIIRRKKKPEDGDYDVLRALSIGIDDDNQPDWRTISWQRIRELAHEILVATRIARIESVRPAPREKRP